MNCTVQRSRTKTFLKLQKKDERKKNLHYKSISAQMKLSPFGSSCQKQLSSQCIFRRKVVSLLTSEQVGVNVLVGDPVGKQDGTFDVVGAGDVVGRDDGAGDTVGAGDNVGVRVGSIDGDSDGILVIVGAEEVEGTTDGVVVGTQVGTSDGNPDGTLEGASEGTFDGR